MRDRKDLFVEIGTEELPPKALQSLANAFCTGLVQELNNADLKFGNSLPLTAPQQLVEVGEAFQIALAELELRDEQLDSGIYRYSTPRRLAVHIRNVSTKQPDKDMLVRGPALKAAFDDEGKPTKAAHGFARSCGVALESLEKDATDAGVWLSYHRTQVGRPTVDLLPSIVERSLAGLPISKRMRWGAGDAQFVRPVHWIVLRFGDEIVDAEILGVKTGRQTRGHRFHHPESIVIATPAQYPELLEKEGKVLADFYLRRARIRQQVDHLAAALGGQALVDEALLNEVTGLVEWPRALAGNFDSSFLSIPPEILTTTMQGNQRYFPVVSPAGRLLPHFIAVSNIDSVEPDTVRAGNERVIRPRFIDAAFFWEQDRKTTLASRREALKAIAFQEKLGSLFDKTERVEQLAGFIAGQIAADGNCARRAAVLSKCDLVTDMVFEFPNLQGVMGRYYAAHDREPEPVVIALDEQYMPRHSGDQLPRTKVGQALALADRLDTLIGIFTIGYRPTGERDPFGLRRAALGVLRTIIECKVDLDLEVMLRQAAIGLPKQFKATAAVSETFNYIMDRLKTYYGDRGIASDVFNAVMACRPTRPLDFDTRVRAVQVYRQLPEAESLTTANKRISNILKHADITTPQHIDENLLRESAEQDLYQQLEAVSRETEPLFQAGRYDQALAKLASLRHAIDRFFEEVLVMAEDQALKHNRIALLSRLSSLFMRVADLSCLQQSQASPGTASRLQGDTLL